MFCVLKKKKIYHAYAWKHNSSRHKQVILSMISNRKGWHYLAVKKLSALLIGITSKHHGNFYCLNCLHSFETENKRESHKKGCVKIKIFVTLQCLLKKLKY